MSLPQVLLPIACPARLILLSDMPTFCLTDKAYRDTSYLTMLRDLLFVTDTMCHICNNGTGRSCCTLYALSALSHVSHAYLLAARLFIAN